MKTNLRAHMGATQQTTQISIVEPGSFNTLFSIQLIVGLILTNKDSRTLCEVFPTNSCRKRKLNITSITIVPKDYDAVLIFPPGLMCLCYTYREIGCQNQCCSVVMFHHLNLRVCAVYS